MKAYIFFSFKCLIDLKQIEICITAKYDEVTSCQTKEMQGGYQTQSTFLLSRGKCTYRECCHLLLLSVQEARWHGHGRGKADSSGSGQNEQWAREIYFYQLQQYFFFFFSISEMFTHGVSPWALRVRGWRCVGVLFFPHRSISQSGRFSSCMYQAESKETVFRKVLNKESGWTEEREDERAMLMLVSK